MTIVKERTVIEDWIGSGDAAINKMAEGSHRGDGGRTLKDEKDQMHDVEGHLPEINRGLWGEKGLRGWQS